ncbi:hypothetical protein GC163_03690 [bacterium]|nr:hypothetical protein [bacterium]
MRRWLATGFITSYLAFLGWGIVSHALKFQVFSHPVMYFTVWDMFCGWQAYESRIHIVAEGDSGTFYELSPPPWGDFAPFGDLARVHYDALGNSFVRIAQNTLKNTEHEPIRRMLVVEECWQKKYNLPEHLWAMRFDEPKDPKSYFWLRATFTPEGDLMYAGPDFVGYHASLAVCENPRLMSDAKRGRPFFSVNPALRGDQSLLNDPSAWAGGPNSLLPYTH